MFNFVLVYCSIECKNKETEVAELGDSKFPLKLDGIEWGRRKGGSCTNSSTFFMHSSRTFVFILESNNFDKGNRT